MSFLGKGPQTLRFAYLGLSVFVLLLDQATKLWIRSEFHLLERRPVIDGFFSLTYHRNTGGAFGFLQNLDDGPRGLLFLLMPAAITVVIVVWSLRSPARPMLPQFCLAGILGGALGNMLDRMRWGYVVDFFYFYLGDTGVVWPAFNVADAFISTGVVLLLFWIFLEGHFEKKAAARSGN